MRYLEDTFFIQVVSAGRPSAACGRSENTALACCVFSSTLSGCFMCLGAASGTVRKPVSAFAEIVKLSLCDSGWKQSLSKCTPQQLQR